MAHPVMLQKVKQAAIGMLAEIVAGTPLRRVFLGSARSRVVIFTLHRMADPANEIFGSDEQALRLVLRRIHRLKVPIVGLEDVLEAERGARQLPPVSACFTLDDGYHDQGDVSLPLLLAHEARPTLFLITGFLDGCLWPWDARVHEFFRLAPRATVEIRLGEGRMSFDLRTTESRTEARRSFTALCTSVSKARREQLISALASAVGVPADLPVPTHHRPMTWARARELEEQGARFGSHSVSHRLFSKLPDSIAAEELVASHGRLQAELGNPLPVFSWPIGRRADFGQRDIRLAAQAGYAASVDVFAADHFLGELRAYSQHPLLHRHGFPDHPNDVSRMIFALHSAPIRSLHRAAGRAPDIARVRRMVFVCKGNICRSPYAEARARLLGVDALSCGIFAAPGAEADPAAQRNALLREVDLAAHRSKRLDQIALGPADLLVAMDRSHHRAVAGAASRTGAQWTDAASWLRMHGGLDSIADPYGRGDLEFQSAFDLIDDAVQSLVATAASTSSRAT